MGHSRGRPIGLSDATTSKNPYRVNLKRAVRQAPKVVETDSVGMEFAENA
jgi:hypothetical protein